MLLSCERSSYDVRSVPALKFSRPMVRGLCAAPLVRTQVPDQVGNVGMLSVSDSVDLGDLLADGWILVVGKVLRDHVAPGRLENGAGAGRKDPGQERDVS